MAACLSLCRDVTAEHNSRDALSLINEELKHRVKNSLAVLGAVATQTFREKGSKADLEKYLARLAAFGRAHDLLTAANWASAPLPDVISTALTPYGVGEGQIHAVRATTYRQIQTSARSVLGTQRTCDECHEVWRAQCREWPSVDYVEFRTSRRRAAVRFNLAGNWRPAPSEPERAGFGSRLISRVLEDDFSGSVEVTFGSTGLICLNCPLENLAIAPR